MATSWMCKGESKSIGARLQIYFATQLSFSAATVRWRRLSSLRSRAGRNACPTFGERSPKPHRPAGLLVTRSLTLAARMARGSDGKRILFDRPVRLAYLAVQIRKEMDFP